MSLCYLYITMKTPLHSFWLTDLMSFTIDLRKMDQHTRQKWLINGAKHDKENQHEDVIKWKHFPRYWPFVRGIHRGPVNSPHKGQWRGALMFTLICARIKGWVNNREAGDLRRYHAHYDIIVMITKHGGPFKLCLGMQTRYKGDPWQQVQSSILKGQGHPCCVLSCTVTVVN